MANSVIKINAADLTAEQIESLKQFAAAGGMTVEFAKPKQKSLGKLEGKLTGGKFTCFVCGRVEDYESYSDEEKADARKTGACKHCNTVFNAMKSAGIKSNSPRTKNAMTAAEAIKEVLLPHLDEFDEETWTNLQSAAFCKKELKTAYPLFIEVPANASKAEKDALRKPNGKHARYGAAVYEVRDKSYFLTNDFYFGKNVERIVSFVENLFPAASKNEVVESEEAQAE